MQEYKSQLYFTSRAYKNFTLYYLHMSFVQKFFILSFIGK